MPPPTNNSLNLLLNNVLETQRQLSDKLDAALARMATKDDIAALALRETTERRFSDAETNIATLTERVANLEAGRLPRWFWPSLTSSMAVLSPILTVVAAHYLK